MMEIIFLFIAAAAIVTALIRQRLATFKDIDEQFENLEKNMISPPETKHVDPSEDVFYVGSHETDGYVHLWQIEPGLNNKEIAYIGRFEKYNKDEYITLINNARKDKSVQILACNPSQGFRDLVAEVYEESTGGV
jgi:hypothetical protein